MLRHLSVPRRPAYTPRADPLDPYGFIDLLILPTQIDHGAARNPERALRMAVLDRALADYRTPATNPAAALLKDDARHWFLSDRRDYPFSFAAICDALDVHPDWLRRRILGLAPALPWRNADRQRLHVVS